MASEQVEIIMSQVQELSQADRIELLKRLADSLDTSKAGIERGLASDKHSKDTRPATGLVYGKYLNTGRAQSTEGDFRLADWRPISGVKYAASNPAKSDRGCEGSIRSRH